MASFRLRPALAACIAALTLGACLLSESPLIPANEADTPLPAGAYDQYEMDDGEHELDGRFTLERDGADYRIVEADGATDGVMRFKSIGGGLFAAMTWEPGDDGYWYFAARKRGRDMVFWFGDCDALTPEQIESLGLDRQDYGECLLQDFASARQALTWIAESTDPMLEWRRAD